jgi:Gram-negative bacterial TonB protein C-terminal
MLGAVLFFLFATPQASLAQCAGKPTVWMNERTADLHLLSSRKFVFPAVVPVLARIRNVVVMVTVNRKGVVCRAKADVGPMELQAAAEKIVRASWRYRPFLLDRKPVVVQFPVTVHFVISADRKDAREPEFADASPMLPGASLPFGPRTAVP